MAFRILRGNLCDERASFHPLREDDDVEARSFSRSDVQMMSAAQHSTAVPDTTEEQEIANAKSSIAEAKSGKELLRRATMFVKSNWKEDEGHLAGNIYRIAAFGMHVSEYMFEKFLEEPTKGVTAWIKFFGFITIAVVQLCGPPAMCLSTVFAWGIYDEDRYRWERFINADGFHPDFEEWRHVALTKALGMVLIGCFCLNATFVLLKEIRQWKRVNDIFLYVRRLPGSSVPGEKWLFIGGFINCWMVVWCCIDAYILIGGSLCPKDCIMDALGLIFLFNLDDVGGDLNFVNEDSWPGHEIGWVYMQMVEKNYVPPGKALLTEQDRCGGFWSKVILHMFFVSAFLTGTMAICLPMLSAVTPWYEILPDSF